MAHVQTKIGISSVNTTTLSVTLDQPIGPHNGVLIAVVFDNTYSGTLSVTDDQSNSYNGGGYFYVTHDPIEMVISPWYAGGITNGPQTITISLTPSAGFVKLVVSEFSRAAGISSVADGVGVTGANIAAGNVTTGTPVTSFHNEDLWWAVFQRGGGDITTATPGVTQVASENTDFSSSIFVGNQAKIGTGSPPTFNFTGAGIYQLVIATVTPAIPPAPTLLQLQGNAGGTFTIKPRAPALFGLQGQATLTQTNETTGQLYIT